MNPRYLAQQLGDWPDPDQPAPSRSTCTGRPWTS